MQPRRQVRFFLHPTPDGDGAAAHAIFSPVDIPRQKPEDDPEIKARQNTAGKTGFILGCLAAVGALAINLARTERPYDVLSLVIAVLMAALNVPFGIMLALLAEKWTRPKTGKGK
jgi:hypothetical protein